MYMYVCVCVCVCVCMCVCIYMYVCVYICTFFAAEQKTISKKRLYLLHVRLVVCYEDSYIV